LFDYTNNRNYSLEAAYTFQKHIDFIPCRVQEAYKPDGWLGILISDRLYIDFTRPHDFENSFEQLINEIESIRTPSQTYVSKSFAYKL
jgi:hypothetical protein